LITGFSESSSYDESGNRLPLLKCVRHDKVLEGLKFSHDRFVDLCIMSGCDFNTNMPNYAAFKSYNLLQTHGSIDNLPRNYKIECLKHLRCREIFSYVSSDILTVNDEQSSNSLDIDKNAITSARDYLEMVGISGQINKILYSYNKITPSSDGYIDNLSLPPAPKYVPPKLPITLNIVSRSPTTHQPLRLVINK
jgi:hypothetical protein